MIKSRIDWDTVTIDKLTEADGPYTPVQVVKAWGHEMSNGRKLTDSLIAMGIRLGVSHGEIYDILHETVMNVYGLGGDPNRTSIRSPVKLVRSSFMNRCRLYGRKNVFQNRKHVQLDARNNFSIVDPKAENPLEEQIKKQQYSALWEGVNRLGDLEKEIILLHYDHELTIQEVANELDIQVGTVKSRLSRALEQLRSYLNVNNLETISDVVENGKSYSVPEVVKLWKNDMECYGKFTRSLYGIGGEWGISDNGVADLMVEAMSNLLINRKYHKPGGIKNPRDCAKAAFIDICKLYGQKVTDVGMDPSSQVSYISILPPRTRQAIELKYHYGLENSEIADIMGITQGSVLIQLWRARYRIIKLNGRL